MKHEISNSPYPVQQPGNAPIPPTEEAPNSGTGSDIAYFVILGSAISLLWTIGSALVANIF